MRHCKAILKGRDTLCNGTTGLYFEKPDGFKFKPGQFANFTLDSVITTDPGGITRSLSIASAPHEKDLMVAMRMRDTGFKRIASALPIGAPFLVEGPYGNLILHRDVTRPAVFLAGGIGITPFRSMIRHATEVGSAHKIFLFYSIRRFEEAAFLKELREKMQSPKLFGNMEKVIMTSQGGPERLKQTQQSIAAIRKAAKAA